MEFMLVSIVLSVPVWFAIQWRTKSTVDTRAPEANAEDRVLKRRLGELRSIMQRREVPFP
jgi:hypothetical protein